MSDNVTKMHPSGKKGMGQRWMLLAGIVLAAAIVAALYFSGTRTTRMRPGRP